MIHTTNFRDQSNPANENERGRRNIFNAAGHPANGPRFEMRRTAASGDEFASKVSPSLQNTLEMSECLIVTLVAGPVPCNAFQVRIFSLNLNIDLWS